MAKRKRGVRQLIADAGGPRQIAEAIKEIAGRSFKAKSVYDWFAIGIPEKHWQVFIERAQATPEELYSANREVRASGPLSNAA